MIEQENLEQNQDTSGLAPNLNSEIETENPNEVLENSEIHTELDLESDEPQPYTETNPELESFLNEAKTTKAEHHQQAQDEKAKAKQQDYLQSQAFTPEEAAGYAVKFMGGVLDFAREQTGKDIQIKPFQAQIGAALFTPVIMKYGPAVKQYMLESLENVDSDSNVPEYMAAGGLLGMIGLLWSQSRKAPPIPTDVTPNSEMTNGG